MKVYIICPVRRATNNITEIVAGYVADLEGKGHNVHYPPRDVEQSDKTGFNICCAHREAMENADEVHMWWDQSLSSWSPFDLGMAWTLRKPIKLINAIENTPHKSGNAFILEWIRRQKY